MIVTEKPRRSVVNTNAATRMGMVFLFTAAAALAERPLTDYSFIRGAC
jgi:hypothetical protein